MAKVTRTKVRIDPDMSRVLIRPFFPFPKEQSLMIVARIMSLTEEQVRRELKRVLQSFADRHFSIENVFERRFETIHDWRFSDKELTRDRRLLIGAYFTSEYSLECAALFNPSLVPHPDQSGLPAGSLRFIMSLRAVGEGHVSSISFREGVIDSNNGIRLEEPCRFVTAPEPITNTEHDKVGFKRKVFEMSIDNEYSERVLSQVGDSFTIEGLRRAIAVVDDHEPGLSRHHSYTRDNLLWLALSNYEIEFAHDNPISARVIFPNSPREQNGIEDARFVRFVDEAGEATYYATYTAYSGRAILPQLLETKDFLRFKIITLSGKAIENKGMAMFPTKIDGRYAIVSRQDAENMYIMFSDDLEVWREKTPLARPAEPWEFVKLGNCGSPIALDEGWLVINHGVGPMRKYCIGAFLLDKKDPTRIVGRLREPLLRPVENEREGYVPNVVYSCGSLVHNDALILPYAMSDYASRIAVVDLRELLSAME